MNTNSYFLASALVAGLAGYTATTNGTTYFESSEPVETIVNKTTQRVQENCDHLPVLNLYSEKSPDTNIEEILASCNPQVQEYVKKSYGWRYYIENQHQENHYAIVETIRYYRQLDKILSEVSPEAREFVKTSQDWKVYIADGYPDNYMFTFSTIYYYDRLLKGYKELPVDSREAFEKSQEWKNILLGKPDREQRAGELLKTMNPSLSWGYQTKITP